MRRLLSQYSHNSRRGLGLSSQFRIDRSLPPHISGYVQSRCKVLRIRRMEEVVVVAAAEAAAAAVVVAVVVELVDLGLVGRLCRKPLRMD